MSTPAANRGAEQGPASRPEHPGPERPPQARTGRSRRRGLRNWRVRTRLFALIAIPTAFAVLLGALRIAESADDFIIHQRVEAMAELSESVTALAHELGNERLLTMAYLGAAPGDAEEGLAALEQHREQTVEELLRDVQTQAGELDDPGTALAQGKLDAMVSGLQSLDGIRTRATESQIAALPTAFNYRSLIQLLLGFVEEVALATENQELTDRARAQHALAMAGEELSFTSALTLNALSTGYLTSTARNALVASGTRYDNFLDSFQETATEADQAMLDESFGGLGLTQMQSVENVVVARGTVDADLGGYASQGTADEYRRASLGDPGEEEPGALASMYEVGSTVSADVTAEARDLQESSLFAAIREAALVLLVTLLVFLITVMVARSMVLPLRTLRDGALRVADRDLPEAIMRMRESGAKADEVEISSVGVDSVDEIGEVARSFDEVHNVALRLAADEAELRSNVNAMFVNLSRRSQTLVERQLRLIEGLERGEQDDARLGDLFQLDHLATRMRRNNENLLVLSGQENSRKWSQPVPLVDVLRGAVSEVEHYTRVNVRASSQLSLQGRPVNDVIHLVAELLENATAYSAQETQVSVVARELDGGDVRVEISDSGIGMSEADLAAINERLAQPPVIDVAVSRRMGLFVVSHLAARHGIQVRLHPAHNGGITAVVVMPGELFSARHSQSAPPAALGGGTGVPDTYAEATAAFAASPAPSEPGDVWQAPDRAAGGEWERETRNALPRRTPSGTEQPSGGAPGGEDLWDTRSRNQQSSGSAAPPPPAGRRYTGPVPMVGTEHDGHEDDHRAVNGHTAHSESAPPAPAPGPPDSGDVWNRPPEEANEPLREQWGNPDAREGYGSTTYLSRRTADGWGTVVPPAPEPDRGEPLPIFDAVESNWFRRRTVRPASAPETGPLTAVPPAAPPEPEGPTRQTGLQQPPWPTAAGARQQPEARPDPQPAPPAPPAPQERPVYTGSAPGPAEQQAEEDWHSEADAGWKAAKTVSEPESGGLTSAGLPRRVPKANLVPGTAPTPQNTGRAAPRSADRVRNRLSGLQQGIRQGRSEAGGERPPRNEER